MKVLKSRTSLVMAEITRPTDATRTIKDRDRVRATKVQSRRLLWSWQASGDVCTKVLPYFNYARYGRSFGFLSSRRYLMICHEPSAVTNLRSEAAFLSKRHNEN